MLPRVIPVLGGHSHRRSPSFQPFLVCFRQPVSRARSLHGNTLDPRPDCTALSGHDVAVPGPTVRGRAGREKAALCGHVSHVGGARRAPRVNLDGPK
jgi:hypothetical protein